MRKILFLLLFFIPLLSYSQETHVYDCYQDTMFLFDRPNDGNSYEYYWIQVDNPDQREITLQVDGDVWYADKTPYKYCIEINGVLWTSPWIYSKDKNIGPYGYLEYFNDQLITHSLDWPDVPLDFHHKQRLGGPSTYPWHRYEDGWIRGKVKSTAQTIKVGIYSDKWYPGLMKPSCLIQEGLNKPQTDQVRFYDLSGREVIPSTPGFYIESNGFSGELKFFGEWDIQKIRK